MTHGIVIMGCHVQTPASDPSREHNPQFSRHPNDARKIAVAVGRVGLPFSLRLSQLGFK